MEGESASSDKTNGNPRESSGATYSDLDKEKNSSTGRIETLGVMFVHGIGEQKPGDTLIQCGTKIHRWLRQWISQPSIEGGSISVDLLDTNITHLQENEPAHTRLIFRKEDSISHLSWLLAESCWADSFRPPRYREFVQWAIKILPLTIIHHLLKTFHRDLHILNTTTNLLSKTTISFEELTQLRRVFQLYWFSAKWNFELIK